MTLRISPSRYRRNIANAFAHELLDAVSPEHPSGCEATVAHDGIRATLVLDRHWEPDVADPPAEGRMPFRHAVSGLATVMIASTRFWKHRNRQTFVRERLAIGWQPEDLARTIFDAMEEIRTAEVVAAWRERVYDEMQTREIGEPLPERVEDHPTRFEEMSIADCEFWLEWLARLPQQRFIYRAPLPWRPGASSRGGESD